MRASSDTYKNLESLYPGITDLEILTDLSSYESDAGRNAIRWMLDRAKNLGLVHDDFNANTITGPEKLGDLLDDLEATATQRIENAYTLIDYNPDDHFPNFADDVESAPDDLKQILSEIGDLDELEYEQMAQIQQSASALGYEFEFDLQGAPGVIRAKEITPEEAQAAFVSYGKDVQWAIERIVGNHSVQAGIKTVRDLIDNAAGNISTKEFDKSMEGLSSAIVKTAVDCGIAKQPAMPSAEIVENLRAKVADLSLDEPPLRDDGKMGFDDPAPF